MRINQPKKWITILQTALLIALVIDCIQAYSLMSTSAQCMSQCLAQTGKTFCPSSDMKTGYCCSTSTDPNCPKGFGYCSGNFTNSPSMQNFMCPFESFCGSNTYQLYAISDTQTLTVSNTSSNTSMEKFTSGSLCHYSISGPSLMGNGDAVLVRIDNLYMATIDIVTASSQNLLQIFSQQLSLNTTGLWYRISYPNQPYIVVHSLGSGSAFTISYQYVPDQISEQPPSNVTSSESQQTVSTSSSSSGSSIIFLIIGAGATLLIVALIVLSIWGFRKWRGGKQRTTRIMPSTPATMATLGDGEQVSKVMKMLTEDDLDTKAPSAPSSEDIEKGKRSKPIISPDGRVNRTVNNESRKEAFESSKKVSAAVEAIKREITIEKPKRNDSMTPEDFKNENELIKKNTIAHHLENGKSAAQLLPQPMLKQQIKTQQSQIEQKANALDQLRKKREDMISGRGGGLSAVNGGANDEKSQWEYEEASQSQSSYWETDSKGQSQWSSSIAYSSWSKMERNKINLPPIESSLAKKKPSALPLPAKAEANIQIVDPSKPIAPTPLKQKIIEQRVSQTEVKVAEEVKEAEPKKKKHKTKKKRAKKNQYDSEASDNGLGELENRLAAVGGGHSRQDSGQKLLGDAPPSELRIKPVPVVTTVTVPLKNVQVIPKAEVPKKQEEEEQKIPVQRENRPPPQVKEIAKDIQIGQFCTCQNLIQINTIFQVQDPEEEEEEGDIDPFAQEQQQRDSEMGAGDEVKSLKKKQTKQGKGAKKKDLFKNPAFLGFDFNKSIDQGATIEPRDFTKKQKRLEEKFIGFD